jgi:hypothetical protein
MVNGLPSGPMTYLTLGRWGSVMEALTQDDELDLRTLWFAA